MLTAELLTTALHISKERAAAKLPFLLEALRLADCLDDPYRMSCYVAQVAHESGRFKYRREIWGPTKQQLKYEPPNPLALRLGNVNKGDGKRFMGRGDIQTTGRANYLMMSVELRKLYGKESPDLIVAPAMLEDPFWCTVSGAVFWRKNRLNIYCDERNFLKLTKRINGGTNGLAERMEFQAHLYKGLA